MKKGCLYFHQGWTDIINQLSLINYYRTIYDEINVIMRKDAADLLNYYIRNLPGVVPQYIDMNGSYNIPPNHDILFHGTFDLQRTGQYCGAYSKYLQNPPKHIIPINGLNVPSDIDHTVRIDHYNVEAFYLPYDIDHKVRIDYFNVTRDIAQEERMYEEFVKLHGDNYIIYHDDPTNVSSEPTKINFNPDLEGIPHINLNRKSTTFFEYLKIIRHAKEIHLIDSSWAAICYHMNAAFENKPINLYLKRGYYLMFALPKHFKNWNLILC